MPHVDHSPRNGQAGVDIDQLEIEEEVNSVLALADVWSDEFIADVYIDPISNHEGRFIQGPSSQ